MAEELDTLDNVNTAAAFKEVIKFFKESLSALDYRESAMKASAEVKSTNKADERFRKAKISNWEFVCGFYEDTPCGILAYILDDEIIIPWIYVDQPYRRRSIASKMLEALKEDLEEKLLFTGFSCEIFLDLEGGGLDLIDFFASLGDLDIMPKYCIYEVSPKVYKETFAKHSMFKNTQKISSQRYVDLPNYQKRAFRNNPKVEDIYQIDQMKNWEDKMEKDLSLCIMEGKELASAN